MTLAPGTRFGAYEIEEAVGSGGMGEVYRARDPRLGRDVAIKLLPAAAEVDEERRARFAREAKAVAALNHPNIVTVYAVEDADGVPFFTMEYVQGRTLAQMIPARGLPLDEVLRIAIPLTDAVAAAHEHGILHRDLKPANVMVTPEGRVKVLDFGLAKFKEAVLQAADGAQATVEGTGEGRILGTVAYMSPEQAEGKPLDQRSDVFALGVLLYEMATGQRPFKGETSVSVISAILRDAPGSVTDLRPDLPRDFGRIVKHALHKDPEHRYQTAKDLRNDLETLKQDLDSGEVLRTAFLPAGIQRGRRPRAVAAVLLVVAIAVAGGAWWAIRRSWSAVDVPRAPRLFDDFTLTRLTTEEPSELAVAVSPDGRYIAYVPIEGGRQSLRVRQVDTGATVQVVAPADVRYFGITFSPDGNRLYYVAYPQAGHQATLYEVPVLGGTPRRLIQDVDRAVGFSPDGARLAFMRGFPGKGSSIMIANADGTGERTLVTREVPREFAFLNVAWSPDGRTLASAASDGWRFGIVTVDVATAAVRPVGKYRWEHVASVAWPRDDGRLFVAATDLSAADTEQIWEVSRDTGETRRITRDVGAYSRLGLTADARTIVTVRAEGHGALWVAPSAQPDRPLRVASVPDTVSAGPLGGPVRWTPDGHVLYTADVNGNYDVWSVRPDGSDLRQLTTSPALDGFPTVAPDGRYIVFVSARDGRLRLWRMDPDGGGQTALTSGSFDYSPVIAADSRTIYFLQSDKRGDLLSMVPIEGGQPTLLSGPPAVAAPARWQGVPVGFQPRDISADGSLLIGDYYDYSVSPNGPRIALVSTGGQAAVRKLDIPLPVGATWMYAWTPDGRAVTYVKTTDGVENLWRQAVGGGPPARLTHYTGGEQIASHAWSRDGKLLALVRGRTERQVVMLRDVGGGR